MTQTETNQIETFHTHILKFSVYQFFKKFAPTPTLDLKKSFSKTIAP
jgi:hypothetical protein